MPNVRALIIDDNFNNVRVLEQLLQVENIETVRLLQTANLSHELDTMQHIDVVFLDLEMPGMNGYDALNMIKAHSNFRSTQVVAYSVHVGELNNALDMGFDGFLGKPLSSEVFPSQLQRILGGEKVWYLP